MKCPGCGYERNGSEQVPDWQCPACGIAYNKHPNYHGPLNEKRPINKQEKSNLSVVVKLLLGFLIFLGVVLTYSAYERERRFNPNDQYKNEVYNNEIYTHKKPKIITPPSLAEASINLNFLSTKMQAAKYLAIDCREKCQSLGKFSTSCNELNIIIESTNTEITRLRNYYRSYGRAVFSSEELKLVDGIKSNLNEISAEGEAANSFCKNTLPTTGDAIHEQKSHTQPAAQEPEKIHLADKGINLRKIQYDVSIELKLLEKCAESCFRFKKIDVNCKAFYNYKSDEADDYKEYIDVVNEYGIYAFHPDEQQLIRLIDNDIRTNNQYHKIIRQHCYGEE